MASVFFEHATNLAAAKDVTVTMDYTIVTILY